MQGALAGNGQGVPADLIALIVGSLLVVFSLWWIYFAHDLVPALTSRRGLWLFSYGHVLVFASVAALGACLASAVDVVQHEAHVGPRPIAVGIAICVTLFALTLAAIYATASPLGVRVMAFPALVCVVVAAVALIGLPMGVTVLVIGVVLAGSVAVNIAVGQQR